MTTCSHLHISVWYLSPFSHYDLYLPLYFMIKNTVINTNPHNHKLLSSWCCLCMFVSAGSSRLYDTDPPGPHSFPFILSWLLMPVLLRPWIKMESCWNSDISTLCPSFTRYVHSSTPVQNLEFYVCRTYETTQNGVTVCNWQPQSLCTTWFPQIYLVLVTLLVGSLMSC